MAKFERTIPRVRRRVVYVDLDDELDGGADELEFGAWLPAEGNLAGLCTANCQEVSESTYYDQSEAISHALCAQRGGGITLQAPICNTDAVNDIARKWPRSEPYASARPSENGEKGKGTQRRYKERHNYAKALLRSDKELEKLSRKIRSEIQQSEILELALEAERAANAGFQSFSARPSTFGVETLQNGKYPLNLRRTKTFSEGETYKTLSISHDKRMKLHLRNVSEVIPQWKELHSHMRTHLFRRKVEESSLVFREVEKELPRKERNAQVDGVIGGTANESFNFFGGIADMTMSRLKARGVMHEHTLCDSTDMERVVEEDSQASGTSNSSKFGPTLSSHLSPLHMGKTFRRPSLSVPPGLIHPDETKGLIVAPAGNGQGAALDLPTFSAEFCGGTPQEKVGCICGQRISLKDGGSVFCSSHSLRRENSAPVEVQSVGRPDDAGTTIGSRALFDTDEEENVKGGNYSPREQQPRQTPVNCPFARTPRRMAPKPNEANGYATPAGLRDIRSQTWHGGSDMALKTPELMHSRLEPSSIIETSKCERENDCGLASRIPPLHQEDAILLALPPINDAHSGNRLANWSLEKLHTRNFSHSEQFAQPNPSSLPGTKEGRIPQVNLNQRKSDSWAPCTPSAEACYVEQNRLVLSEEKMYPSVPANAPLSRFEVSNAADQEVAALVKSVGISSAGSNKERRSDPRTDDDVCSTSYDRNEEKKECEQATSGINVQFSANQGTASLDRVFPFPLSKKTEDAACPEKWSAEIYENTMQSAMSFDLESHDDDSSMSLSIENEDNYLGPASTWGGGFAEDRMLIRKTLSWPGGTLERQIDAPGSPRFQFDRAHLAAPTTPTFDRFDMGLQNPVACSDTHGICHSFPSPDENFQVAVEEMMARLSPNGGTWRRDTYVSEDENMEFLNNYFYCTKIGGGSNTSGYKRLDEQICVDPCHGNDSLCHHIGVDTVCNGIQFIFTKQSVPPAAPKSPRQRALSLDTSLRKDNSISWLRSVQELFTQIGSRFEPYDQKRQESVQFDPPCLKKAAMDYT